MVYNQYILTSNCARAEQGGYNIEVLPCDDNKSIAIHFLQGNFGVLFTSTKKYALLSSNLINNVNPLEFTEKIRMNYSLNCGSHFTNPAMYFNLGLQAFAVKDYDYSIFILSKGIEHTHQPFEDQLADLYNLRGVAFTYKLLYREALVDINCAIRINATVGRFFYNRGIIFNNLGLIEQANMDFKKAHELDPTY